MVYTHNSYKVDGGYWQVGYYNLTNICSIRETFPTKRQAILDFKTAKETRVDLYICKKNK